MKKTNSYFRFVLSAICVLSLVGVCFAQSAKPAPQFVSGRLLIKFKDGISPNRKADIFAIQGVADAAEISGIGVHIVQLPAGAVEAAYIHAFQQQPEVESAQLDQIHAPSSVFPNDPQYYGEWPLGIISAPDAWSITTGSTSLVVAVIDTGVEGTHQDLSSKMVPGAHIVGGTSTTSTSDVNGHGTEGAGIIAAASNNGIGITGVCWGCKIMPVRVTDQSFGYATSADIASGITWAADHGAKIASVGYASTDDAAVTAAAQYFYNKGGLVVMPSGNLSTVLTTSNNPYVVTVGSTDTNDLIYAWSNTGTNLDLVATGYTGATTYPGNTYAQASGTSISASFVAGVAALVLSVNPSLTPAQVTGILNQSVDDLGVAGKDLTYGYGRINALKAVNNAGSGKTSTTTTVASSLNPSVSGQSVTFTATVSPLTATGTVTFLDGSATIGSGTLSSGRATFSTSTLSAGSHSITASYGGSSNYNGSSSSAIAQSINAASKIGTSSSLASSLNPSTSGQTVTFTATVSPSTATGTVTFKDGTATIGSGSLISGRATFSISTLAAGTHSITSTYGGDASNNASTSNVVSQTVNGGSKTNTTTSLATSLNPSKYGQLVTFTASVSPSTATGSVTFRDGATTIGSGTLSGGRATFSTSALSAGAHSITSVYAGDASNNGSTSNALSESVSSGDFTISSSASSLSTGGGKAVQFTLTVTPNNGFNSIVSFNMASNAAGPTASFSPSSLTGSGSTTVTVQTTGATKDTYTLTLTGSSGALSHSTTVTLKITH